MFRRGKAVWLLAIFAVGCPDDPSKRDECSPGPDFLVTVRADHGSLPGDLKLAVEFGGGNEELSIGGGTDGQIIFCDLLPFEVGDGGRSGDEGGASGTDVASYGALQCELWTEGPATVQITASGFEPLERDLRIDEDECTTPVELELTAKRPPM